ncbi:hypothetical protein [Metabacillus halosaccharovorans]|uniref:hypothetical protein n=1 Tax=Metabacillus halosaccharovorans TaxID=930124 RepID=UPI003736E976
MKIKKRILSYVVDLIFSIVICAFLSISSFIILAILALLLLPFVASDGDTWNPILTWVMNGMLLFGAVVFMLTSLGINLKFTLPLGYKLNGLLLKDTNKLRLFTWWFMRNGIIGLFILLLAYHIANEMDYNYLFLPIFIYILYLVGDGIAFFLTKGKRTLTDIWTGVEVLETTRKDSIN